MQLVEIALPELAEVFALNVGGGLTVAEGYAWHRRLLETHRDRYDPVVATRFSGGASVTAADYLDLLAARERLTRSAARVTGNFDALVMPTVPIVAPRIADLDAANAAAVAGYGRLLIRNPVIANVFDRCALSLPCHEPGNATVGLVLRGESMADRRILAIGLSVAGLRAPGE